MTNSPLAPNDRYYNEREQYLEKALPSNNEAERVILGAILIDNSLITQAIEGKLGPEDFYSPMHRQVFKAMVDLFDRSERIDPILIGEELKRTTTLDSFGGVSALTGLMYGLPTFSDIVDYARIVKDKSITRTFIKKCSEAISNAQSEDTPIEEVIDGHEQGVFQLRSERMTTRFEAAGKLTRAVIEQARNRAQNQDDSLKGLSTGLRDVNEKLNGLCKTDLIIVAARPSMGKTSKVINWILNATDDDPEAVVAVFSMEVSKEAFTQKMIIQRAKVDSHRFEKGFLTRDEWARIAQAQTDIESKRIFIDDDPTLTALEINAKARRLFAEQKRLDLAVIDHLGWIKPITRQSSKNQEVGETTKALKAMAKGLKVPVVLICQLSRGVEARNPPKPIMSDLRDSGNIEEDADIIAFIYREEYYTKLANESNKGVAEFIISKNRNGPTGTVKLAWIDYCTNFEDYYPDDVFHHGASKKADDDDLRFK